MKTKITVAVLLIASGLVLAFLKKSPPIAIGAIDNATIDNATIDIPPIAIAPMAIAPIAIAPMAIGERINPLPLVSSPQNPHLLALLAEYENYIRKSLKKNQAPGAAVAIVRDSSIIFLKGFGKRDSMTGDSLDTQSVFRIASVSKCFASALSGVLVDEKKFTWDDHVATFLPLFKLKSEEQTQALNIGHVLSHTTGLPYHAFTDRVDAGADFDTLVYHLRDLDLLGKPGQLYSYQNVGYSLIGEVIHAATGKTYEENLKEKLFAPLHMLTASANYDAIAHNDNVARPHRFFGKWVPMKISSTYYNVAPAGGVNASISDMALFLRELTTEAPKVLSLETREEIFKPRVRAISRNNYFWHWKPIRSAHYALGWRVLKFRDDVMMYHGGFVNGYRSEIAILKKDKISICVLVNAAGTLANASVPDFFVMYSKYKPAIDQWEADQTMAKSRQASLH